jgi:hypothetical protein
MLAVVNILSTASGCHVGRGCEVKCKSSVTLFLITRSCNLNHYPFVEFTESLLIIFVLGVASDSQLRRVPQYYMRHFIVYVSLCRIRKSLLTFTLSKIGIRVDGYDLGACRP